MLHEQHNNYCTDNTTTDLHCNTDVTLDQLEYSKVVDISWDSSFSSSSSSHHLQHLLSPEHAMTASPLPFVDPFAHAYRPSSSAGAVVPINNSTPPWQTTATTATATTSPPSSTSSSSTSSCEPPMPSLDPSSSPAQTAELHSLYSQDNSASDCSMNNKGGHGMDHLTANTISTPPSVSSVILNSSFPPTAVTSSETTPTMLLAGGTSPAQTPQPTSSPLGSMYPFQYPFAASIMDTRAMHSFETPFHSRHVSMNEGLLHQRQYSSGVSSVSPSSWYPVFEQDHPASGTLPSTYSDFHSPQPQPESQPPRHKDLPSPPPPLGMLPMRKSSSLNSAQVRSAAAQVSSSSQANMSSYDDGSHPEKKLRIKCILHASTALTQKRDECSITYLNRGQQYAIHLQDTQGYEGTITSTIAITFHDPGHRNAAANYWKFWIGQQRDPQHARAIDLVDQSQGIVNVRYTSFDRISFDWQGSRGATVQTRFNCLSTDFSRIKGVKGIPLRIHLESTVTCSAEEAIDTPFARCSSGSFRPLRLDAPSSAEDKWSYNESCFCKIKLFRDKGAERKNKDDAKHIAKQFEKAHCDSSDPLDHPMWKLYKRPVPYTVFGEIPQPSTTYTALDTSYAFPQALMGQKNHTRTMTAPSTFSLQSDFWHLSMPPQPSTPRHMTPSTATVCSAMMPHPFSSHDTPLFTNPHGQQEPAHIIEDTPIVKSNGIKRSRDHEDEGFICSPSKKKQNLGTGNSSQSVTVSLIFHCRTAEDLSLPSSPEPVVLDENRQHQSVFLKDKSVDELKRKVCETLALQVDHVSQILWRRKNKQQGDGSKNGNKNEYFVLVDDEIIARHVRDKTTAAATWDIRSDGRVRLILEMSP